MNQATINPESPRDTSAPVDYPFKADVLRLLSHAQAFLTSLMQMQSIPLGRHHTRTLEQVRLGMEHLAFAADGVVAYLTYSISPGSGAGFEVWSSDLQEDLTKLLRIVQQVEENVERFSLLLSHDSTQPTLTT